MVARNGTSASPLFPATFPAFRVAAPLVSGVRLQESGTVQVVRRALVRSDLSLRAKGGVRRG
jgi:hypothetical protein